MKRRKITGSERERKKNERWKRWKKNNQRLKYNINNKIINSINGCLCLNLSIELAEWQFLGISKIESVIAFYLLLNL